MEEAIKKIMNIKFSYLNLEKIAETIRRVYEEQGIKIVDCKIPSPTGYNGYGVKLSDIIIMGYTKERYFIILVEYKSCTNLCVDALNQIISQTLIFSLVSSPSQLDLMVLNHLILYDEIGVIIKCERDEDSYILRILPYKVNKEFKLLVNNRITTAVINRPFIEEYPLRAKEIGKIVAYLLKHGQDYLIRKNKKWDYILRNIKIL